MGVFLWARYPCRSMGRDPSISLDFVLDMHAHSTAMNAFCFVNLLDNDMAKMQKVPLENAPFSSEKSRSEDAPFSSKNPLQKTPHFLPAMKTPHVVWCNVIFPFLYSHAPVCSPTQFR